MLIALLPTWGAPRVPWLAGPPFALAAARRAWTQPARTATLIPAQAFSLMAFLAAAAGMPAGLLLAR